MTDLYRTLLRLRARHVSPHPARSRGAEVLGPAAVLARWSLGERTLAIASNFAPNPVPLPAIAGDVLFTTHPGAAHGATLPGHCTVAVLA